MFRCFGAGFWLDPTCGCGVALLTVTLTQTIVGINHRLGSHDLEQLSPTIFLCESSLFGPLPLWHHHLRVSHAGHRAQDWKAGAIQLDHVAVVGDIIVLVQELLAELELKNFDFNFKVALLVQIMQPALLHGFFKQYMTALLEIPDIENYVTQPQPDPPLKGPPQPQHTAARYIRMSPPTRSSGGFCG